MSSNNTGKLCEAPGCDRKSRSGSATYCDTHYLRIRRGTRDPLRALMLRTCPECGKPTSHLISKYCSRLCGERARRGTLPERQRGRTPPIAMVEADVRTWHEVLGFPDYEISNDGRLRRRTAGSNTKAHALIRPSRSPAGYPQYGLTSPGGKRRGYQTAHRLVALAFLPPPAEADMLVLHRNDDKLDARETNLRWGTPHDNANDAIRNKRVPTGDFAAMASQPWAVPRGEESVRAKLTEDQVRIILASPESSKTLGARYEVSPDAIVAIRLGKNWRHVSDGVFRASLIEGREKFGSPHPKRKRLSTLARFELLKRENYRCHLCMGVIYPGQAWDISHEIPIELGGPDDESNRRSAHRKCHRTHTANVDIPAIAKAKRIRASHHGAKIARQPMRGGRNDFLKRKMDGTVVFRDTGKPASYRPRATR